MVIMVIKMFWRNNVVKNRVAKHMFQINVEVRKTEQFRNLFYLQNELKIQNILISYLYYRDLLKKGDTKTLIGFLSCSTITHFKR
jgi:hypothetical protein